MADEGGPGAAHEILSERVAALGETEGDGHLAGGDFDIVYHPEVYDVTVLAGGMADFPQGLKNVFSGHYYFTRFISLRR